MRTALVGGGASGIGHAVAERLAGSGDRVVITGRHADTLEAAAVQLSGDTVRDGAPREVHALVSDMTDPASAAAAMEEVGQRYGGLDVLVLNAGGPPPAESSTSTTPTGGRRPNCCCSARSAWRGWRCPAWRSGASDAWCS